VNSHFEKLSRTEFEIIVSTASKNYFLISFLFDLIADTLKSPLLSS